LVDYFVTNEPLLVKGKETAWSREQVWDVLERLIRDETGLTKFSEDARFVEDMHID
jgi:mannose/cellobiose epimerase-like protein (N-acyl-D-glucosamine 2-epimerase family)